MDGNNFDKFARAIAGGMSRRKLMGTASAGAGASLLSVFGLDSFGNKAFAEDFPALTESPKVEFEGLDTVISVQVDRPTSCTIVYGVSRDVLDKSVGSDGTSDKHKMTLPRLAPESHFYFRVQFRTSANVIESDVFEFNTPACPAGSSACGGTCVADCGPRALLTESCECICEPGVGNCDGDPSNGCETTLGSTEHCLACGNNCDDGNACTDNVCDPVNGCIATNVSDGTSCGSAGVCESGICLDCVSGGTCAADADCCDAEICCNGTCVARDTMLDDIENCGACGNVCPPSACQNAICVQGACQVAPAPDGDTCDDGNPCTTGDHCMSGTCMGNPANDDAACGQDGICSDGVCVECTEGGSCDSDAACCSGEVCCDGTCAAEKAFEDDKKNCGSCGNVCKDSPCQAVTCEDGECVETPLKDGTECGSGGICTDGVCAEVTRIAQAQGTVFEDNFEAGSLRGWTSASGLTVQSDLVGEGKFAARARSKGSVAYARKSLDSPYVNVYARTRFHMVSQGRNSAYLIRTFKSGSAPLLSVFISSSGRLSLFNNVTGVTTTSRTVVAPGAWHEIQLRVKVAGTKSLGWVWLNGVRVDDISKTTNLGDVGVKLIQLGDNVTGRTYDIAFDDFAICNGDLCPALDPISSNPGESTSPGAASGVILTKYRHNASGGVNWAKVMYKPRQFNDGLVVNDPTHGNTRVDSVGGYAGWDIFLPYNYSVHRIEKRSNWTVLELKRPATIAVVWRDTAAVPSWLKAWTKSENVVVAGRTMPTYRKSVPAGTVNLGAVYNPTDNPGPNITRDAYWVLIAEQDGLRSPAPVVPGGKAAPAPNQTCPAWVHDQYAVAGPDGGNYATWHALIDPVYWCYHRHEHGTDPANFDAEKRPVFGYTAARHGMSEPHQGFKNHVFDSTSGTRWMVSHHFGTAGLGRACNRFHTVDIAVKSISTGELLADLHFMADFGPGIVNTTRAILKPPTCPNQGADAIAAGSTGVRMIPSKADGPTFYEPWRADLSKTVFGFVGDFTVNNPDGMVICNNSTCDQPITTGNSGTQRFFTPNQSSFNLPFGINTPKNTGVFYTDPNGTRLLKSSDAGAVRQYIKPGAKFTAEVAGHCYDVNAWGSKLVCGTVDGPSTDREGSVQAPN